jgi:hypothetical protein
MFARKTLLAVAASWVLLGGCSSQDPRASFRPDGVKAVDYPFVVTVDGFDTSGSIVSECTGSVVTPSLVLTAGQCAKAAVWHVTAPYAGGQSSDADQATPTEWQGVADQSFSPDKSDTGFIQLRNPINLDKYPSLADASSCMGCEVVHVGRVTHAVAADGSSPDGVDRNAIAPGNAGGPIIRVADGAIIGVSAGTVGTKEGIAARPRRALTNPVLVDDGKPTYWASSDLFVSPLHVAVPTQKTVLIFPQHTLLNLGMAGSKAMDDNVNKLVASTGVGTGGVPGTLKYIAMPGGESPTVAGDLPPEMTAPSAIPAAMLHALGIPIYDPTKYVPPPGSNVPGSTPPGMAGTTPTSPTAPNTVPGTPPAFPSLPSLPQQPAPPPYMPPDNTYQKIGNIINLVSLAGNIANMLGGIGNLLGGFGFDMGGCS